MNVSLLVCVLFLFSTSHVGYATMPAPPSLPSANEVKESLQKRAFMLSPPSLPSANEVEEGLQKRAFLL